MEGNGPVLGKEVEPIKVFWILDKQTACTRIGFMVSEETLTVQEKERISITKPFGKGEREEWRHRNSGWHGQACQLVSGTFNKCP